jgi:hypothetical protein
MHPDRKQQFRKRILAAPEELMNEDIRSAIIGVVSNVLTMFLVSPFSKGEAKNVSLGAMIRNAIEEMADTFEWTGTPRMEEVCLFLATPEVESVLRQMFSTKLVGNTDDTITSIRREFISLFARHFELSRQQVSASTGQLFSLLLESSDRALGAAIDNGVLAGHEALSVVRYRQLHDEIAAVQRNLAFLTSRHIPSVRKILAFEEKYRSQVAERHERITPPNFDSARKVPIDDIYVSPEFVEFRKATEDSRDPANKTLTLSTFFLQIYRAVLLGNPGGGKSTLKDKLCFDLASRYEERPLAGRTLTPVPVILRDYGSEKKLRSCSILQFIESTANSSYQVQAPKGAFEYLLLNGRVIVIFDGLDELLDTSYRQSITADVESFCNLYPSVPILVTSREVGYEQAPLDEKKFVAYKLAPFNDSQIAEYVTKWFIADTDLTRPQRQQKTQSFLRESSIVPDLRSNPLMLALMCNIYRGENYIPQNRPDLYEKCAVMLFERWDKNRGIIVPLPFEAHIKPAMMFLAHWIYTHDSLQSGVDEGSLINKTADYLLDRRYDDRDEAELAAREFIEFCKGRAWVFTDTGAGLYQFTHRTFLEYFTAFHLVRRYSTPSGLLEVLIERISKREWDIVAQLSIQLLNKHSEGAGDEILSVLANSADRAQVTDIQSWNLLNFACRCLNFIVPSSTVRRLITTVCLDRCLKLGRSRLTQSTRDDPDRLAPNEEALQSSLGALLSIFSENQATIAKVVEEWLVNKLGSVVDTDASLAIELLFYLPYAIEYPHYEYPNPDRRAFWRDFSERVFEANRSRVDKINKEDWIICNIGFWRGEIDIVDFIKWYGIEGAFCTIPYRIFPMPWPPARQLLGTVLNGRPYQAYESKRDLIEYSSQQLDKLGSLLLHTPPPWLQGSQEEFIELLPYIFQRHYVGSKETLRLGGNTVFGGFAVLAAGLEVASLRERKLGAELMTAIENSDAIICDLMRWSLLARFAPVDEASYISELNKIPFSEEQRAFVIKWIRREINTVNEVLPTNDQSRERKRSKRARTPKPSKKK